MKKIFIRFSARFFRTFAFLFIESLVWLFIPLAVGIAINDLVEGVYRGLFVAMFLGVVAITLEFIRRGIDARSYAWMYKEMGRDLVYSTRRMSANHQGAQLTLLSEIVEFLENEMPILFRSVFGLIGTLVIIFVMDFSVGIACVLASLATFALYMATAKRITQLNAGWNDEFERRGDIVGKENVSLTTNHLERLTRWSIRLSDIENIDSYLSWLTAVLLLVYTLTAMTYLGAEPGSVIAVLIYVVEFIVAYLEVPKYYNEWLRIEEISERVEVSETV